MPIKPFVLQNPLQSRKITLNSAGQKTASERQLMRAGGRSDQLVRLANDGRLVDGGRHRQHDLLLAGGTPRRIA